MSNYINIVQEPVSTTSPQVKLVQPYILKAQNYYNDWGFNLVNGKTNVAGTPASYVVYQKGNAVTPSIGGKSVVLGDSNIVMGCDNNVIVIGNHLEYHKENGVAIGQYNNPGAYPDDGAIVPDLVIASGSSDIDKHNEILAYKSGGNHILRIGDNVDSYVLIPIWHPDNTKEFLSTRSLLVKSDAADTYEPILTGAKLAAVISGITGAKVTAYDSHIVNTSNPHNVTKSQVGLGDVVNTGDSGVPVQDGTTKFTSGGAYVLQTEIDDINSVIPVDTTSSNKLTNVSDVGLMINIAISAVYKPKGSATASELNSLTKSSTMNGYVYNITSSGTLTNSDSSTVSVISGDNVAFLWNNGSWHWDVLSGFVDLSNYYTKTETNNLLDTKVDKTTTIAGIALSSNISAQDLTEALNYDVDQDVVDYIMGVA